MASFFNLATEIFSTINFIQLNSQLCIQCKFSNDRSPTVSQEIIKQSLRRFIMYASGIFPFGCVKWICGTLKAYKCENMSVKGFETLSVKFSDYNLIKHRPEISGSD